MVLGRALKYYKDGDLWPKRVEVAFPGVPWREKGGEREEKEVQNTR